MKILALIPARSGSKRLPQKNILPLCEKPLIVWTIEVALKSRYISDVLVSTDSEGVANIAKDNGAWVPFLRPDFLSTDTATSFQVAEHAVNFCKKEGKYYDYLLLLQPTSPLRSVEDIDRAIEFLIDKSANSITSVCETEHSPLWTNTLPHDFSMNNFQREEYKNIRSQDLPIYYRLNGAIYLVSIKSLLQEKSFISSAESFAFVMPQERSVDIDTKIDFFVAKSIIENEV